MRIRLGRGRYKYGFIKLILLILFLCAAGFAFALVRLQPAFMDYASRYAQSYSDNIINKAIDKVYSDDSYSNLTQSRDESIKTVETDTVKVNRLKARLNSEVLNSVAESETVYIPIGNALGWYFLRGMGPKIPIKICPIGIVSTDLRDEFSSAGINQVYHKIYLDVSLELSYIGFLTDKSQTVETTALVSETVIVGDTPQYYGTGEPVID